MATMFQYRKGEQFHLPTPTGIIQSENSYQFSVPDGKALSDFVGWATFTKKGISNKGTFVHIDDINVQENVIQLSDVHDGILFPDQTDTEFLSRYQIRFDDVTSQAFSLYGIWDRYVWSFDSYMGVVIDKCIMGVTEGFGSSSPKDENGFFIEESLNHSVIDCTDYEDPYTYIPPENIIVPNIPVKWSGHVDDDYGISGIMLNGKPFAGIDVTEAYWNEHRNDLYKDIPESLSANYVWTKPLESDMQSGKPNAKFELIIPSVTSAHVRNISGNRNGLLIGFRPYELYGTINFFSSHDEAKTVTA